MTIITEMPIYFQEWLTCKNDIIILKDMKSMTNQSMKKEIMDYLASETKYATETDKFHIVQSIKMN